MENVKIQLLCPRIGWEVGPSANSRRFFAITTNGDPQNIDIVRSIIAEAPTLPNWDIFAGRPRRPYNDEIIFQNQRGQQRLVCLSDWRYVLTAFDSGRFFDVAIATDVPLQMDESARQQLLRTTVEFALGELLVMKRIDRMSFVDHPDSQWEWRSTPFAHVASHLDSLTMVE